MEQMRERRKTEDNDVKRFRQVNPEEVKVRRAKRSSLESSDSQTSSLRSRRHVKSGNYCTCVDKRRCPDDQFRPLSSASSSKKSFSQGNLMNIHEEEVSNTLQRKWIEGGVSSIDLRHLNSRKVTSDRLLKIAVGHHLPRLSPSRPVSRNPSSRRSNDEAPSVASSTTSTNSKLRAKRQRNRTLTMGINEPIIIPKEEKKQESTSSLEENSNNSSSGSDPGICLQFNTEVSSSSSDDETSIADSLEINLTLFDKKEEDEETAVSLAFVEESATVHKYIASRGQREKEEEIYEVLPPTIAIKKGKRRR